jgi:hypothetical protein
MAALSANATCSQKQGQASPQPSPWALVDQPVAGAPDGRISVMNDVLKPYLLLACVAFFVGFVSYLAVGRALAPPATDDAQASISTSAIPDEPPLARGKQI